MISIKKILYKGYLWFISKFKSKKMIEAQHYNELLKIASESFNNLSEYLRMEESKGYLKFEKLLPDRLIFHIGLRHFILFLEIKAYQNFQQILFETFEIVDNENDYGKLKLVHLKKLDIQGDFQIIKFITIPNSIIREFGSEYIREIINQRC